MKYFIFSKLEFFWWNQNRRNSFRRKWKTNRKKKISYDKNYNSGIETVKKLVEEFDKISEQTLQLVLEYQDFRQRKKD